MADLSKINALPNDRGTASGDGTSEPRTIEEAPHRLPTGGLDSHSSGVIENAFSRLQIMSAQARQILEEDRALLLRMAGNAHVRRPAGRPAKAKKISKEIIETLFREGLPRDTSNSELAKKVNQRLKRDGRCQVSEKTVSRARRELGQN